MRNVKSRLMFLPVLLMVACLGAAGARAEVRFTSTPVEVPPTCQAVQCGDNFDACKSCHLIAEEPPPTASAFGLMSSSAMTTASAPATTTVTSPDGKFTLEYPPTVPAGVPFENRVTVWGYAMTYDYFVDNVFFYGT